MTDFAKARQTMVDCQIRPNDVTNPHLVAAMLDVPREDFVPEAERAIACRDADLPLGGGRFMMKPMVLGKMIQFAAVAAGDRVLVVGAGTGYSAALLAHMGASVVALESDAGLVARARALLGDSAEVVEGPLQGGAAAPGPYDVILVEGAAATGLAALAGQLKEGGRLVAIEAGKAPAAVVFTRSGHGQSRRSIFNASAALLPGFEPKAEFVF